MKAVLILLFLAGCGIKGDPASVNGQPIGNELFDGSSATGP